MKNQTSISIRQETKDRLRVLMDSSEKRYFSWDEFFCDFLDTIAIDYNIKV